MVKRSNEIISSECGGRSESDRLTVPLPNSPRNPRAPAGVTLVVAVDHWGATGPSKSSEKTVAHRMPVKM